VKAQIKIYKRFTIYLINNNYVAKNKKIVITGKGGFYTAILAIDEVRDE